MPSKFAAVFGSSLALIAIGAMAVATLAGSLGRADRQSLVIFPVFTALYLAFFEIALWGLQQALRIDPRNVAATGGFWAGFNQTTLVTSAVAVGFLFACGALPFLMLGITSLAAGILNGYAARSPALQLSLFLCLAWAMARWLVLPYVGMGASRFGQLLLPAYAISDSGMSISFSNFAPLQVAFADLSEIRLFSSYAEAIAYAQNLDVDPAKTLDAQLSEIGWMTGSALRPNLLVSASPFATNVLLAGPNLTYVLPMDAASVSVLVNALESYKQAHPGWPHSVQPGTDVSG